MGDRRVADRRAPEEGVVKIETKKLVVYIIIGTIFIISIITNLILGILYSNYKNAYESITNGTDDAYIHDDFNYTESSEEVENNYSCDLSIVGDKEQVKAGETITYEIKAENINAGNGIIMFSGVLDYDTDTFECEIIDGEEWKKTAFIDNYMTLSRQDLASSAEDQTIVKIALTAKEDIQSGDKVLSLSNIEFTMDDDTTFSILDESVVIPVIGN